MLGNIRALSKSVLYGPAVSSHLAVNWFYWLDQLQPEHRLQVGDKTYLLSRLLQRGYPVVSGLAISSDLFRTFLEAIQWREPFFADLPNSLLRIDIENARQLQAIAQQFRQAVDSTPVDESILSSLMAAVQQLEAPALLLRPSLVLSPAVVASIPHAQTSAPTFKTSGLLNFQVCRPQTTDFVRGLKALWAELFNARSLFYWQRMKVPLQEVGLSVLVQPLSSVVTAGTLYADSNQIEIHATPGLELAISRGEVQPDRYWVSTRTGQVQNQSLGWKLLAYHLSPSDSENGALPLLTPYLLEAEQQQEYALSSTLLPQLVALVQQALADFHTALEIEWLVESTATDAQIKLTQITPCPHGLGRGQAAPGSTIPLWPATGGQEAEIGLSPLLEQQEVAESRPVPIALGLGVSYGCSTAPARVVTNMAEALEPLPQGTVLVAVNIPLNWLPQLKEVAAIVTEQGSMTCHSAIVARELGIPAVMGVSGITQQIQTGEWIRVDGQAGRIYRVPLPETGAGMVTPGARTPVSQFASIDRTPLKTQLMVTLSQPERLEQVAIWPVDGIGLLRSELLAIAAVDGSSKLWIEQQNAADIVERLAAAIQRFAQTLAPRPVFFRSLDLRSHEFMQLPGQERFPETNPMLGLRGTFRYQLEPALFHVELAALAQVQRSGSDNVHLLLPFVRTVEEFTFCRQQVRQAGLMHQPHFQLWIMAEVPSVLFLLPDYVKAGVQGIAIGTNDLTQLLLGVDRDHAQLTHAFDANHPAVQAAIAQLIHQARQFNLPCSICGQAVARNPKLVADLIRWGITAISVEPEALETTYRAILQAEQVVPDATQFLE